MSAGSVQISNLLEKMASNDKDFRFMGTNDLMLELQKDSLRLDDESEKKVMRVLLKLLEDKSGEVQNLAVKCLGPLVLKVKEAQVETIVDTLCEVMIEGKEQMRDISSIGLKTLIAGLPSTSSELAAVVCKRIIGKLSVAISQEDVTVQLEALDIIGEVLSRFGNALQQYHAMLLDSLLPQLSSSRQTVRKRTVAALGNLSASCCFDYYQKLVGILLVDLEKSLENGQANTYIQCCATVCKYTGQRFAEYLDRITEILMQACQHHEDDELRETILQAFEVFVTRCPVKEALSLLPGILDICVKFISYDPNRNDEDTMGATAEEDEGESYLDEEQGYSDDDDLSWKVRRAAAKCIEAVIVSRPDFLTYIHQNVSLSLISRFQEREETVRCDVFSAYRALLRATRLGIQHLNEHKIAGKLEPTLWLDEQTIVQLLESQITQLVKIFEKQLKEKDIKSRQFAVQLLSDLVTVLPRCLIPYLSSLISGILFCLLDRSNFSNVKTSTLSFLYTVFNSYPVDAIQVHVEVLLPALLVCAEDNFYKVTSEALIALQALVRNVRSAELGDPEHPKSTEIAQAIYPVVLRSFQEVNVDQEVKEAAITTMATLFAHLGNSIKSEWPICILIFLERLKNERTRLTTVKAFNLMADSKLVELDFKPVLGEAVPVLSSFLKLNQKLLKLSTLNLLHTFITLYAPIDTVLLENVICELPHLLRENDLHCAQHALQLLTLLSHCQIQVLEGACALCMPAIKVLVRSLFMQGAALNSLLTFLQALVKAEIPTYSPNQLVGMFLEENTNSTNVDLDSYVHHKQNFSSLAKCISMISLGRGNLEDALNIASGFIAELGKSSSLNDVQIIITLLSIGEIGRHVDLSMLPQLLESIQQMFLHSSLEVKAAASRSFGYVAIGNLGLFLPVILKEMETQPRKQYLLLQALKHIIMSQKDVDISSYFPHIWEALFVLAKCPEEGTRNLVAECLGQMTLARPDEFLPVLQSALESESSLLRGTVINTVRFTILEHPPEFARFLLDYIGHFLTAMTDPDLGVRRIALIFFNAAAHNKPALIRDLLPQLLPKLYAETFIRPELVKEVEMGPFKHKIDNGLELRKAAFDCMYTLLGNCLDQLDIWAFICHTENGLRDHIDIKIQTYLIVSRLAAFCPLEVYQTLDLFVKELRNAVNFQPNPHDEEELNKQKELKLAAIRVVNDLQLMHRAEKHSGLMEMVVYIQNDTTLQKLIAGSDKDTSNKISDVGDVEMTAVD